MVRKPSAPPTGAGHGSPIRRTWHRRGRARARLCGLRVSWRAFGRRHAAAPGVDALVSVLHTGLMTETPQFADWLTWWSWPWRMSSESGSPAASFAPQTLNQPILPGWLLGSTVNVTEENSSSPETEQQIVESHSYGQQLGRVLDVVNELIAERPAGAPDVQSIQDFAKLWQSVEQIKVQSEVKRIEKAIADLASMKKQRSDEYQRLAIQLRAVLEE